MEALAPPQWAKRPRREGVTLNCTVGERPLSRCESSRPVESQSTRALSEYQGGPESRPQHTSGQRNQCQGGPG